MNHITHISDWNNSRITTVGGLLNELKKLPRDMPVRGDTTPAVGVFLYGGSGCPIECKIQDYDDHGEKQT